MEREDQEPVVQGDGQPVTVRVDARAMIRDELAKDEARRKGWMAVALVCGVVVYGGLIEFAHVRDVLAPSMLVSLAAFFFALIASATLVFGVPLMAHPLAARTAVTTLVLILVGTFVVLLLSPTANRPEKPGCLITALATTTAMFFALRAFSGSIWRRFPDASFPAVLGASTFALAFLAIDCGTENALHLLLFHVSAIPVVYLAGWLTRRANAGRWHEQKAQ